MRLTIPYPTKSNNELRRMSPFGYRDLRNELTRIVQSERRAEGLLTALGGERRRVVITRYGPQLLDYDNLVGGAKPLIDALCNSGAIWDDDPKHLDVTVKQEKSSRREARTEVEIFQKTESEG